MKYFLVRDLGYDGLYIREFSDAEEADTEYQNELTQIEEWIKKYGEKNANKGIALIEGNILRKQDIEFD